MNSTPEGRPLGLLVAALVTGLTVGVLGVILLHSETVDEPVRSVRKKVDAFKVLLLLLVGLSLLEVMIYVANLDAI
tara:strand:- start:5854 stop:6081 length:228 start_codon:yes stop_codon:yes gene_type:complete